MRSVCYLSEPETQRQIDESVRVQVYRANLADEVETDGAMKEVWRSGPHLRGRHWRSCERWRPDPLIGSPAALGVQGGLVAAATNVLAATCSRHPPAWRTEHDAVLGRSSSTASPGADRYRAFAMSPHRHRRPRSCPPHFSVVSTLAASSGPRPIWGPVAFVGATSIVTAALTDGRTSAERLRINAKNLVLAGRLPL
jgi:hypothetical protein